MYKNLTNLLGESLRTLGQSIDRFGCKLQGNYAYIEKLNRHTRISKFRDNAPFLGSQSFIAPNASVIGCVNIGHNSSVWYNSVLRGDVNSIEIGNETIIGDRTVVHVSSQGPKGPLPTVVGNRVYVGPGCILHACVIGDHAYVGAGSIVYDGAVVEKNGFLEAGSLLTAGKRVLPNQVWGGSPARYIRDVTKEDLEQLDREIDQQISLAEEHDVQTSKSAKQQHLDVLILEAQKRAIPEQTLSNNNEYKKFL
eukprot:gene2945-3676_t